MWKMEYTGFGYPSKAEIDAKAKLEGYTHSYWASEYGYNAMYNGDTVVVYNNYDDMPADVRKDAEKHGKPIA